MGSGITRAGAYGHFQRHARLVKLALPGVENRQVVVGLGQLGMVFGQFSEGADCFIEPAGVALNHAFDEAHLRIARLAG